MAAKKTGVVALSAGALTDVDSTARNPVGTRVMGRDALGNTAEFIYLQGIGSTVEGSVVTFDEAGVTALIAANAKGPVAIAMAATVANKYGWYCIQGTVDAMVAASTSDNSTLGRETNNGEIGDGRAAGDEIANCFCREANAGASAALCAVQIDRPFVNDFLGA